MTIASRLIGWLYKLPPAETRDIVIERNLEVPMPDGVVLRADRYYPRGSDRLPTILMRTPYGRAGLMGAAFALPFAERGFQVVVQSCRGTFGSDGEFDPFRAERPDGLATLAWLKQNAWFSGEVAMFGPSYLGFVQWAVADAAGPELKALSVQISGSQFRTAAYPGGSFWLEAGLTWVALVSIQEESVWGAMMAQGRAARAVRATINQLPLRGVNEAGIGRSVPFFWNWLDHAAPEDPYWTSADFSGTITKGTAPAHLLGGWYDVLLPHILADYESLRRAGRKPYLTIGPWTHTDQGWLPVAIRESLTWFRAHLLGDRNGLRDAPVRVFVMGADEWRDFSEWPPPGHQLQRWHLQPGAALSTTAPVESEPDHYRYDPADPTPSVGGSSLSSNSGPKDNRALEARSDVLVYTSQPLDHDLDVIGPVTAELYVKSSLDHTDFFARLCDVYPSGKSINVSDGLLRLVPGQPSPDAGGHRKLTIDLWPVAVRFKRGHRIRVQVSSGAHPRYARNLGGGEPLGTGTKLVVADQSVYHDPAHPSGIVLAVMA